jgi:signal peptidase II
VIPISNLRAALILELREFLRRPAVCAAAAGLLALDLLLSHVILLSRTALDGATILPGLLDFRYAWNRGISFSLLWQSSTFGSWALAVFQTLVAALLLRWAVRSEKVFLSASLVSIAAGALGNVVSRILHGAVFDYFAFHIGDVPFFVFNISDALISLGVIGIVVETIWPTPWSNRDTVVPSDR